MPRTKLIYSNRKTATIITFIIFIFGLIAIVLPLILLRVIPQSVVGHYLLENIYYGYFTLPIMFYIIYTGVFYFKIKVDSYIIDVRSYRTISGLFKEPNYIDISHAMLNDFAFFNRPFSFNKTLMIKIKTDTGKKVAKRFNLTCLSKKDEEKINKVLEKIKVRNN